MRVSKTYQSAFVLEPSKLTRLMSVINEKLADGAEPGTILYEAHLKGSKVITTPSVDEITRLDNSERSRINRLVIAGHSIEPIHSLGVDFDGKDSARIEINVESDDAKWVADAVSVVEEQVERTLEQGVLHKVFNNSGFGVATLGLFVSLSGLAGALAFGGNKTSELSSTMWLNKNDLGEISKQIQSGPFTVSQMAEVQIRQLRNIIADNSNSSFAVFKDWRVLVALLPIVALVVSLAYLSKCYPGAVFLWGDAEEWYRRLVSRRRTIWNVVVIALVVGVIANLAVFAFSSLIGSTH